MLLVEIFSSCFSPSPAALAPSSVYRSVLLPRKSFALFMRETYHRHDVSKMGEVKRALAQTVGTTAP